MHSHMKPNQILLIVNPAARPSHALVVALSFEPEAPDDHGDQPNFLNTISKIHIGD